MRTYRLPFTAKLFADLMPLPKMGFRV